MYGIHATTGHRLGPGISLTWSGSAGSAFAATVALHLMFPAPTTLTTSAAPAVLMLLLNAALQGATGHRSKPRNMVPV